MKCRSWDWEHSLSDEECYNSVTALLESGGRLIDTAYMYGNEAAVGRDLLGYLCELLLKDGAEPNLYYDSE